jgi:ferrochelatase
MIALLMMAHGTPEKLDQMEEYLTRVRGGRPPSPELIREMKHNYAAIGGRSPLTDLTRAQGRALEEELGPPFKVFVGMRNWHPFIVDAAQSAVSAGAGKMIGLPMAPQYSALSVEKYLAALREAVPEDLPLVLVRAWFDHPGVLDAFAERAQEAMREQGPFDRVVFTAHSLPRRAAQVEEAGLPSYSAQVRLTAKGVAGRLELEDWQIAYQSAGRTPEPWLGPDLLQVLSELSASGFRRVLVIPIGFACDHTEVLYDIDIQASQRAREKGIELVRCQSLNSSATFIGALADIVRRRNES